MLHSGVMAKEMMSARVDDDLRAALSAEASGQGRSVSNMLEWILRERYSERRTVDLVDGAGRFVESVDVAAVLTERDEAVSGVPEGVAAQDGKLNEGLRPDRASRSVSAAAVPPAVSAREAAEAMKELAVVPPAVHDVLMRTQAAKLALRDGKCSADVARGTKCKLCGKVHG